MTFFVHSFDSGGLMASGRVRRSVAPGRVPASLAGGPRSVLGKVSPAEHVQVGSAGMGDLAGLGPLFGLLSTDPRREEFHVSTASIARMWRGPAASNER